MQTALVLVNSTNWSIRSIARGKIYFWYKSSTTGKGTTVCAQILKIY